MLESLPSESVDAVITDPPYSSGGATLASRQQDPRTKYNHGPNARSWRHGFSGDGKDQRSWTRWCMLWLGECMRVVKPAGYVLMFTDWRQLPSATDAFQAADLMWRGIIPWDKTEGSRAPNRAYFRHQAEYVIWGTKGPTPKPGRGPFPGVFRFPVRRSDKHHVAGKPTDLLVELCRVVPEGGVVLDPFAGSGTTGVAAARLGLGFIGVEIHEGHFQVAARRIAEEGEKAA
ncbi:MAG: site-specific DNA-methyltransferase [Acidobacteriota bacterium]